MRTSVLASRGTERTEGRRFGWLSKAFLKRRGCVTIAQHGFRMRLRRRFYITMGLEDRALQEKLRELGIERPGK